MNIGLLNQLTVSTTLFLLGIWGIVLNRKNIIIMLMSIELMLLAINLALISYAIHIDDVIGQMLALFVITAESAIGLAILVAYYRVRGTIGVEYVRLMKN